MTAQPTDPPPPPQPILYEEIVRRALREDLGLAGDLTTDAIVPADAVTRARIVARAEGQLAGVPVAAATFVLLDPWVAVEARALDGSAVAVDQTIAVVQGPARAILSAERVALNMLGHLSGIATATRAIAESVAEFPAQVVCTRKTTPGLRGLEKYAVRCGGGSNHRFGLDDAVLVKDNHLQIAGGVAEAVARVRRGAGHMVKIEVEVDSLAQLEEALALGVDAVLLDNMDPEMLREAVRLVDGRAVTEASGGIRPDTAPAIAAAGVDLISVGWLTHSAPALDVALDVDSSHLS
jgi:nicotinate-nucleotide pyrophosphorylase (carboxylating)